MASDKNEKFDDSVTTTIPSADEDTSEFIDGDTRAWLIVVGSWVHAILCLGQSLLPISSWLNIFGTLGFVYIQHLWLILWSLFFKNKEHLCVWSIPMCEIYFFYIYFCPNIKTFIVYYTHTYLSHESPSSISWVICYLFLGWRGTRINHRRQMDREHTVDSSLLFRSRIRQNFR